LPVGIKTGMNHIEYVETMLADLAFLVQKANRPGTLTPQYIEGLQAIGQHIAEHIKIIAQDPNEKQRVKQYGDQLGQIFNLVKAMAQQLQEQAQSQNGNGQPDPETISKIQSQQIQ